jgi:anti-sigma factor RsiW
MSDCANVEMREMLPELLHGRLGTDARARLEAHLATCDDCASELRLMRAARRAFVAPTIDLARIASAVERETASARKVIPPRVPEPDIAPRVGRSRSASWRVAATIAVVALGGMSVVVARRGFDGSTVARAPITQPATPTHLPSTTTTASAAPAPSHAPTVIAKSAPPVDSSRETRRGDRPRMAVGGLGDLSEAELEKLIGAVDRLDASPNAEPERIAPPGTSSQEPR